MRPPSDRLSEAYRAATRRVRHGGDDCLATEVLRDLQRGQLDSGSRQRAVDHLARCSDCADEWRLLRALEEPASGQRDRPRRWWRHPAGWAAAAAVTVALAVGAIWGPDLLRPPAATWRSGPSEGAGVTPEDGAVLSSPPRHLRWTGAGDGVYRVTVYDRHARAIWTSEPVEAAEVDLPEAVIQQLRDGGRFMWRVESIRGTGDAVSPPFSFTVAD